jgi:hypothetical protein
MLSSRVPKAGISYTFGGFLTTDFVDKKRLFSHPFIRVIRVIRGCISSTVRFRAARSRENARFK